MDDDEDRLSDRQKKAATIVDVAQVAGVAIGTVSRYLNGLPIRASNRLPIEQAIDTLGYRRNMVAVSMKRQTTRTVGLLVPGLGEFHAGVLEQLTRRLRVRGYGVVTFCHDLEPMSVEEGLEFFAAHRVNAVVTDGLSNARTVLERYVADGMSLILYDNDVPGLSADRVFAANRHASRRLVDHLIALGHTRIATIHGNMADSAGRDRLCGYEDSMRAHGIEPEPHHVVSGLWREQGGYSAIRQLMEQPNRPTAVYSANYNMTMGALRWLRENRIEVPGDLSLVSFDEIPAWNLHPAGITAIAQPLEKMADAMASLLVERVEGDTMSGRATLTIDANIILRGSARSPKDNI